jgi:hypothetical protein
MKTKKKLVAFAAFFVFGFGFSSNSPVQAQSRELPLEKILNPVPEFDPFERPEPTPQFFPDAVDKRAREALIDAITQRTERLEEHLHFIRNEDRRLQNEFGSTTGLTEHLQDLVNNSIQDRTRYLAAQKQALKNASSPSRKKYLESIIDNDDLNRSDQLMRQSVTNSWGSLLNRMLSSVDLVGVASGNYAGAAMESVISQLYALADRDMPVEERRALARDLDHLKRYPDDPANAEIVKRVEALERRKKSALAKKQLAKAQEASKKGDLDKALFHAELASFIDPQSQDAAKLIDETRQRTGNQEEAGKKALAAAREPNRPGEQQEDVKRLLEALSVRDANQIERLAVDLERKYRGQPLADAAFDAEAVSLAMKGWHEEAKKMVEQAARRSVTPEAKQRAAALLQSPEYDLLASFRDARTDRQLESARYVLMGEDLLKKNLLYAAGAVAAAGPAGAVTLGAVNALLMGNNFLQVMTNNPVSAQPVIDAGVTYVRSHPNSPNASEVYKVLADAYEERGLFERAISYHELAGTPAEKIAAIKEKGAKALLAAAAKAGDRGVREYYLTSVIDRYPESPAAAEATRKLAESAKDENQGLRMSKRFLMENAELVGPGGLGLKPSLFDGDPKNMEIADRGINLIGDDELLVYYQTPWGIRSRSYEMPKAATDRFLAALRQQNQQVAMADVNQRTRGSVGGIRNIPAPILMAEREQKPPPAASERDDSTFSLLREANGSAASFPKVLDHELLSENERDPGSKYKLPPLQGSVSPRRFSMTGTLPAGLWGNQLAVGTDQKGAFAGMQLPIPLLQGFIPVDFMVQGRPGGFSVYPRIHTGQDQNEDPELYR